MGVPLNHPFLEHVNWIFPYYPSILGYHHLWKPPYIKISPQRRSRKAQQEHVADDLAEALAEDFDEAPEAWKAEPKALLVSWVSMGIAQNGWFLLVFNGKSMKILLK